MASLQDRQLELIERMAALDPAPWMMGGWAEDALLAGEATRPHVDVDWLLPRSELPLRLAQAAELGFPAFETWGESAPGEPFYLFAQRGDLNLDLGVADDFDGLPAIRIHKLFFDVDGKEPPVGYQICCRRSGRCSRLPIANMGIDMTCFVPAAPHCSRLPGSSSGW